jgi:hypothetical protein
MGIGHTRSSTRHRVSRQRSRYVLESNSLIFAEAAAGGSVLADRRLVFLGADQHGELLEVMAIETADGALLIIHAQPIRDRCLKLLKGGLR